MRVEFVPIVGFLVSFHRAIKMQSLQRNSVISVWDGSDYVFGPFTISAIISYGFLQLIIVILALCKSFLA